MRGQTPAICAAIFNVLFEDRRLARPAPDRGAMHYGTLRIHGLGQGTLCGKARGCGCLRACRITSEHAALSAHEFSGGQRQRICINARWH